MDLRIFHVDAFTGKRFSGNPAAVCPLEKWPEDGLLQSIAAENNLSETAFFAPEGQGYRLRWMTPTTEVDLCGHATLASAFVLWNHLGCSDEAIRFESRSGPLTVRRRDDLIVMSFPLRPSEPAAPPPALLEGLGRTPIETRYAGESARAGNYLAVFDSEKEVRELRPDFAALGRIANAGVIVTAHGMHADFVSRYFAVPFGIAEDPVTGSSHCTLTPYWAKRLGRERLHAQQVSARGGELFCELRPDRVEIAGRAVLYLDGTIRV